MNSGNGIKPSLRRALKVVVVEEMFLFLVFYYLLGLTAAPSPNRELKMSQCESQPNISSSTPQLL